VSERVIEPQRPTDLVQRLTGYGATTGIARACRT
jgi:hypothetical protein